MPVIIRKIIHIPAFVWAKLVFLSKKISFQVKRFFAYLSIVFLKIKENPKIADGVNPLSEIYPDHGADPSYEPFINKNPTLDLSIVIPAYNVAAYIDDCMETVFAQKTRYTFEVLIVNDGSTDGTAEKLPQYAEKDERVKIITQKNQGRAVACNTGIVNSSGKYIMFLDADDILSDTAVESLVGEAYRFGSDIVEGRFFDFYEGQPKPEFKQPRKLKSKTYSYEKNPDFVLTSYGYSWGKVCRRELFENVRFPNGYFFQDIITKFALRRIANKVTYINQIVAGYLHRASSSSHGGKALKKLDISWLFPRVLRISDHSGAKRDNTLYLLSLNHIGIFAHLPVLSMDTEIKKSVFVEAQRQLRSIQDIEHNKMPVIFRRLNSAILVGDFEAWDIMTTKIFQYRLLSKHREIN